MQRHRPSLIYLFAFTFLTCSTLCSSQSNSFVSLNVTDVGQTFTADAPNHVLYLRVAEQGALPCVEVVFATIAEINSNGTVVQYVDMFSLPFRHSQHLSTNTTSFSSPLLTNSSNLMLQTQLLFNDVRFTLGNASARLPANTETISIRIDSWPFLNPANQLRFRLDFVHFAAETSLEISPITKNNSTQQTSISAHDPYYNFTIALFDVAVVDDVAVQSITSNMSYQSVSIVFPAFSRNLQYTMNVLLAPTVVVEDEGDAVRIVMMVLSFTCFGITLLITFGTLVQRAHTDRSRRKKLLRQLHQVTNNHNNEHFQHADTHDVSPSHSGTKHNGGSTTSNGTSLRSSIADGRSSISVPNHKLNNSGRMSVERDRRLSVSGGSGGVAIIRPSSPAPSSPARGGEKERRLSVSSGLGISVRPGLPLPGKSDRDRRLAASNARPATPQSLRASSANVQTGVSVDTSNIQSNSNNSNSNGNGDDTHLRTTPSKDNHTNNTHGTENDGSRHS